MLARELGREQPPTFQPLLLLHSIPVGTGILLSTPRGGHLGRKTPRKGQPPGQRHPQDKDRLKDCAAHVHMCVRAQAEPLCTRVSLHTCRAPGHKRVSSCTRTAPVPTCVSLYIHIAPVHICTSRMKMRMGRERGRAHRWRCNEDGDAERDGNPPAFHVHACSCTPVPSHTRVPTPRAGEVAELT